MDELKRSDLSVIYYTSNREDEGFEHKIRQALLESIGSLPLISVSQKRIDFGENICVGDVGTSDQNVRRQFQIGAMYAETKYVCAAEADFLYPEEYFQFKPERNDVIYYADSVYVLWHHKAQFRLKRKSEGAIIVDRGFIINTINKMYDTGWNNKPETKEESKYLFKTCQTESFSTPPIVTFKTGNGMHFGACSSRTDYNELKNWGIAKELRRQYL